MIFETIISGNKKETSNVMWSAQEKKHLPFLILVIGYTDLLLNTFVIRNRFQTVKDKRRKPCMLESLIRGATSNI